MSSSLEVGKSSPISSMQQLSIDDWVKKLTSISEKEFTIERICDFTARYGIQAETLKPYVFYANSHYTRNLIYKCDLFEILAICWNIGQVSRIHNHRDQNCWMAAPIGSLLVENFHLEFQDMSAGTCRLTASNTVEMSPEHPCAVDPKQPVHRVVNPREANQRAVSLHVYSRPFDSCVVYSPDQGTCGDVKLHYNTVFGKPAQ
jgi:cysteine dioxygenase